MISIKREMVLAVTILGLINISGSQTIQAKQEKIAVANPPTIELNKKMKVIDLTQIINASIPTYDGKPGDFKYETIATVEKNGYGEGAFFTHEHVGTHIDAPVHFCATGLSIDKLKVDNLVLPAIIIDVQDEVKKILII